MTGADAGAGAGVGVASLTATVATDSRLAAVGVVDVIGVNTSTEVTVAELLGTMSVELKIGADSAIRAALWRSSVGCQ